MWELQPLEPLICVIRAQCHLTQLSCISFINNSNTYITTHASTHIRWIGSLYVYGRFPEIINPVHHCPISNICLTVKIWLYFISDIIMVLFMTSDTVELWLSASDWHDQINYFTKIFFIIYFQLLNTSSVSSCVFMSCWANVVTVIGSAVSEQWGQWCDGLRAQIQRTCTRSWTWPAADAFTCADICWGLM